MPAAMFAISRKGEGRARNTASKRGISPYSSDFATIHFQPEIHQPAQNRFS
jgi:hypothetical protein